MALKSSMRILIVDTAAGNRQSLKKILTDIGLKNVTEAIDGEAAWIKMNEADQPFELIFAEWELPKISGLDLLKKVKSNPNFSKTKYIMVSADAAQEVIMLSVKNGVSNVMVRPFSANTVMEKISAVFNQK